MERETVVNNALELAGVPTRIQSLWDGSPQALIARDQWARVRDEALAARPWEFARNYAVLAEGTIDAYFPWVHRWTYPDSAITVLDVYGVTSPYIVTPFRWIEVHNGTSHREILTDFDNARASFTRRVMEVDDWPPPFIAVVIAGLAERFAQVFGGQDGTDARGRSEQRPRRDGVS